MEPVLTSDAYGNPIINRGAAIGEYNRAVGLGLDMWVVGGCGSETPFTHDGRWTLYVWNPATSTHGYLDLATDIVTEDRGSDLKR